MSRRKLVSFCLILSLSVFSTTAYTVGSAEAATSHAAKKEQAVKIALSKVGKQYVKNGAGPNSFDCSGLTMYSYGKAKIKLPGGHSAGGQYRGLKHIKQSQAVRGDLVYYSVGHIGIYLGNGKMVHAANHRDDVLINKVSIMKNPKFARV